MRTSEEGCAAASAELGEPGADEFYRTEASFLPLLPLKSKVLQVLWFQLNENLWEICLSLQNFCSILQFTKVQSLLQMFGSVGCTVLQTCTCQFILLLCRLKLKTAGL